MPIKVASKQGTYQLLQGAYGTVSTGAWGKPGEGCPLTGAVASPLALMTSVAGLMRTYKMSMDGVKTVYSVYRPWRGACAWDL
jgi:hypothetical protein